MRRKTAATARHVARTRRRRAAGRDASYWDHRSEVPWSALGPVSSFNVADLFLEFAEPLLDAANSQAHAQEAMWVAVTAWNMSFYPDGEWRRLIISTYETATTTGEEVLPLYEELIERRRVAFAGIDCVVTDIEVTYVPDDLHLEVVWHPIDPYALRDVVAAAPSLGAHEPPASETPV